MDSRVGPECSNPINLFVPSAPPPPTGPPPPPPPPPLPVHGQCNNSKQQTIINP